VFCKHKERSTYEVPGGHREEKETIYETAVRELKEETGAIDFTIKEIGVYSVIKNNIETFGMLYYAEIYSFNDTLNSEMECILLLDNLPNNWTYPEIQPNLIKEYEKRKHNFD
jgi:8-oxo-dGTP diphosphatase